MLTDNAQGFQICLEKLIWAMERLQVKVTPTQLNDIAELIAQAMTGQWRFFHTPEHAIAVGGESDPIEVLAALFHDLVYVQVDRSINFNLSYYITPFIKEEKEKLQIRDRDHLPADPFFEMTASVFGFVPGQVLDPFAGQNEFLSAIAATKILEPLLFPADLVQIATCIEATIPFRSKSTEGLTPSELLCERLRSTNNQFNLGLTNAEIDQTVKKAVVVANRDVSSFAASSSAFFLANTWNLLPETNHDLIGANSYTVRDYRIALQKMERFMSFLQPGAIFRQYQGEPDDQTYQQLESRAKKNIEVARLYLGSKLVAIALLESLAFGLGVDTAITTLMGGLPYQDYRGVRLETFLPQLANVYLPKNDLEIEVLNLLENGRDKSDTADLKDSPLATFIVKAMGFEQIQIHCHRAKEFFQGNISAADFIAKIDLKVTKPIVDAILQLFQNRESAIRQYYQEIISDTNYSVTK
jgi:hypothetical protein